jgi:hypothetical protein
MKSENADFVNAVWTRRNCPVCQSDKLDGKPDSSASRPAEFMSWEEAKRNFIGIREDQAFFSYFRCLECGMLYSPYYFTPEQIAELYSEMPDNTMGEDKQTVSKTQSAYAKWIMQSGVSNERYLEIGPDIGLVTREVIRIKTPNLISLVEPNHAVRQELMENSRPVKDVEIVDFIESLTGSSFSLIVGVHVYDHLLEPLADLKQLRLRVEPGAHLSIVVHNEKSILRLFFKAKWPPFCLQHPQLYNPETLRLLLAKSGWEVKEIIRTTNWGHLRHFVAMGASVIGISPKFAKYLPNIEVPIKLGNIICLAKAV